MGVSRGGQGSGERKTSESQAAVHNETDTERATDERRTPMWPMQAFMRVHVSKVNRPRPRGRRRRQVGTCQAPPLRRGHLNSPPWTRHRLNTYKRFAFCTYVLASRREDPHVLERAETLHAEVEQLRDSCAPGIAGGGWRVEFHTPTCYRSTRKK